ncbi:GntR family transcriptional regulator [Tsukamurella paurometabola]|uniref:Transcriptional regulator, GntR family n=1 Tax=Tsukamurella paurometabola (strain ATCC 8368 / DSM 20162 / CCUG 35730 / CIP 100753 / JCM 10117 / KCTC 9821 / NBRC 16120 / NCIMB 702349 / NCTC 13040) TaxID=521096 RepID=D5UPF7_TSUPD|nr:GntR family transcriptional regulator [Tsukamurella paurometabola]ADG78713.1 transcriptional regulator, GntR family [Tsukamurella paurometabola DSM 20162]
MSAGQPLHHRLAAEFRGRIAAGTWPEGQQAPSEAALCEEFGTSRGPVRQALATLRAEGLIVGGQGRSPVVRRNVASHSASALGSFTAWAREHGREPGQRTTLQARVPASAELAERLQIEPGEPVLALRRVRTLDGAPALREEMYFVWDLGRQLMEFDPDSGSVNRFLLDRGADLFASTHRLDAVAATADDAADLLLAEGAPLLRVRRTTTDSAGDIVEYSEDRYVPGVTTVTVENRLFAAPNAALRSVAVRRNA